MANIADILGLGADVTGLASAAIVHPLIQQWQQQENERNLNRQAMIAMGAGMLTGNKGNYGAALPAIGAGVESGQATYEAAKKLQQDEALDRLKAEENALARQSLGEYRQQTIELGKMRERDAMQVRKENAETRKQAAQWHHQEQQNTLEERKLEAQTRAQRDQRDAEREQNWHDVLEEQRRLDRQQRAQAESDRKQEAADRIAAEKEKNSQTRSAAPHTYTDATGKVWQWYPEGQYWGPPKTSDESVMKGKSSDLSLDEYTYLRKAWQQASVNVPKGKVKKDFDAWLDSDDGQLARQSYFQRMNRIDPAKLKSAPGFGQPEVTYDQP